MIRRRKQSKTGITGYHRVMSFEAAVQIKYDRAAATLRGKPQPKSAAVKNQELAGLSKSALAC